MNGYTTLPRKVFRHDRRWFLFGSLIAVTFCFLAIAWPNHYIWLLALIWAMFALFDSLFSFFLTLRIRRKGQKCWPYLLISAAGLLTGLASLFWPDITALILVCLVVAWMLVIAGGHISTRFLLSEG